MSIRSHLSTVLSLSGVTGLFITQGSMRTSFPLALRAFHVPWPSQVKLTSELSAIETAPLLRPAENLILPQQSRARAGPPVGSRSRSRAHQSPPAPPCDATPG